MDVGLVVAVDVGVVVGMDVAGGSGAGAVVAADVNTGFTITLFFFGFFGAGAFMAAAARRACSRSAEATYACHIVHVIACSCHDSHGMA